MLWLTTLFVATVVAGIALQLWLSARQVAAVSRHRARVPELFAERVSADEHAKAADYTIAKARFHRLEIILSALITLGFTVGGGLAALDSQWRRTGWAEPWLGAVVILTVLCITALIELPFGVWRTFRLEARFGFNRISAKVFVTDLLKHGLLTLIIGAPVTLTVLYLMQRAGAYWWLWAWVGWLALMMLMTWAWPVLIAPLFNKFSPLEDPALRQRIDSLLDRCGFASKGVFVIDGSLRSAHGNAYFTGIGRHKRIVFFDTLLQRLNGAEVEAVLAHELGHFSLKHVRKRLAVSVITSAAGLAVLGWLARIPAVYAALGVPTPSTHAALLLFVLAVPPFALFLTPLTSMWSRRHEFEADGFAARHASATELAAALVKLYRDNANTLTPDPVYSTFYYSHPPALERVTRLLHGM